LLIGREGDIGHDGTPVLLVKDGCQNMREPSYAELAGGFKLGRLEQCKTWCWPPIVLREESMRTLREWCARIDGPTSLEWLSGTAWEDENADGDRRRMIRWGGHQLPGLAPSGSGLSDNGQTHQVPSVQMQHYPCYNGYPQQVHWVPYQHQYYAYPNQFGYQGYPAPMNFHGASEYGYGTYGYYGRYY
jgi:hypothetical protein